MSNRLDFTLLALFMIILTGCRNEDEGKLTFEMLSAEKSVKLSNEELSPLCSVSLKMASATKESGEIGEKINAEVVYRLFNQEGIGIQAAMDQYIEQYCSSYRSHMLPLYNEDRADTTKRSWYEFHYIINTSTEQTSRNTLAYLATIDYSEGHANSIHQLLPINFYTTTGDYIKTSDIFVDGYETQLTPMLLKALMEREEVTTLDALKEKGYLQTVDMYTPQNYIVGDNTITFIFNPSEIASLELGTVQLILTYAQMQNIIKPNFLKSLQ